MKYEKALENMRKYGGSFVQHLAILWFVADEGNRNKIEAAFGDIFDKYENIGEQHRPQLSIGTRVEWRGGVGEITGIYERGHAKYLNQLTNQMDIKRR